MIKYNKVNNIISAKFGGSSMGTYESIMECVDIVRELSEENSVIVSVSAVYKTTDLLLEIIKLSEKKNIKLIDDILDNIEDKHFQILNKINQNDIITEQISILFKKLRSTINGINLTESNITPKKEAEILSFGEKLSSFLILSAFESVNIKSERIESERLIKTNSNYLEATVDFSKTQNICNKILLPILEKNVVPITTGFIGEDSFGEITLLGRGGSDYTCSIIGISLDAKSINIYTDVNGIMSADPKIVKKAISWNNLNTDIASEISYSGAKVIHPKAIFCTIDKNIPIYILNTFDRSFEGTKISLDINDDEIKGIVGVKDNVLITLKLSNMLESLGFIAKVSKIISDFGVEIDVLASSEISFTFSIKKEHYSKKLISELSKKASVKVKKNVGKVCIVGNNVLNKNEKLIDIFKVLANDNVEVFTISSGGNYNNITLIIDQQKLERTVEHLHSILIK